MVKALGIGFALLLFYVALHTLPVQWLLTILILSGAVTLAFLPKPDRDPRRWLPEEEDEGLEGRLVEHDGHLWRLEQWTLDDERAAAADRDYDEERSE